MIIRRPYTLYGVVLGCVIIATLVWTTYRTDLLESRFSPTRHYPHAPTSPSSSNGIDTNAQGDVKDSAALTGAGNALSEGPSRVIGLVFYGRKEYASILDCYLQRNLRENGGLLDEVVFSVRTDNAADLEYLEELLARNSAYRKHVIDSKYQRFVGCWEPVTEANSIYIKIDDDIVFAEDDTIGFLVGRLRENPQLFAVSANVVNNPALSWVHYGLGVYESFWPEMKPPETPSVPTWRTSNLPSYEGPAKGPRGFSIDGKSAAPFENHRWLPVRPNPGETADITLTPASTLTYDAFGPGLKNWAAAAQTHASFLYHIEANNTYIYKFNAWDYAYKRLSINFFAIRGRDVMDVFPFPQPDDEEYLTRVRPKDLNRHVVVDGRGLAVHFAFGVQRNEHKGMALERTDLLGRYRDYADERVCPYRKRTVDNHIP